MSVEIRLMRLGAKKRPFFRVVVADPRSPRDGRFIENIGKYHPLEDPSLSRSTRSAPCTGSRSGAQPTETVQGADEQGGIWEKFAASGPAAGEGSPAQARAAAAAPAAPPSCRTATMAEDDGTEPRPTTQPVDRPRSDERRPEAARRGLRSSRTSSTTSPAHRRRPRRREVTEDPDSRGARPRPLRWRKDDRGKVIGRGGRTARAIRTVVMAAASAPASGTRTSRSRTDPWGPSRLAVGRVTRAHGVRGEVAVLVDHRGRRTLRPRLDRLARGRPRRSTVDASRPARRPRCSSASEGSATAPQPRPSRRRSSSSRSRSRRAARGLLLAPPAGGMPRRDRGRPRAR